jgi:hypothetical protein
VEIYRFRFTPKMRIVIRSLIEASGYICFTSRANSGVRFCARMPRRLFAVGVVANGLNIASKPPQFSPLSTALMMD